MHIIFVKIIILAVVLLMFFDTTHAAPIYSGRCVYSGGIFKIELPGDDGYYVAVKNEHSSIEFYETAVKDADKLLPGLAGKFPLSKLNYIKITSVSGPYLKLIFDIYDGKGIPISSIDSGEICNLSWFREKHGSFERYYQEKEPPEIEETVLFAMPEEKDNNTRAAVFCLACFTLGGFMGFRTPKMIEY